MNAKYNKVVLDITNGLNGRPISGSGYITLMEAPIDANVRIAFNDNTGTESRLIPVKVNDEIEVDGVIEAYIWADPVPGGRIVIGQAKTSKDFKIIRHPNDISVDTINMINDFNQALLDKLDKIINPYSDPVYTYAATKATSVTDLINKTLTCDKIRLVLYARRDPLDPLLGVAAAVQAFLDTGGLVCVGGGGYDANERTTYIKNEIELEGVNGKQLIVQGVGYDGVNDEAGCVLIEYTKKA